MTRNLGLKLVFIAWTIAAGCYSAGGDHDNNASSGCIAADNKLKSCGLLSETGKLACAYPVLNECQAACVASADCADLEAYACGDYTTSNPYMQCVNDCTSEPIMCSGGTGTYYGYERCDGFDDCENGADEAGCAQFACEDHSSIPESQHCDGFDDCTTGEDEDGCTASGSITPTCGSGGTGGVGGGGTGGGGTGGGGTGGTAGTAGTGGTAGTAGTTGITAATLVTAYNDSCTRIEAAVNTCAESVGAGGAGGAPAVGGTYFFCKDIPTGSYGYMNDCTADCYEAADCTSMLDFTCDYLSNALYTCVSACYDTTYDYIDCGDAYGTTVSRTYICDGFNDCYYNYADETNCPAETIFTCTDGYGGSGYRCDGYSECVLGGDEEGCACTL